MHKLVAICNRVKWIGLIGILGNVTGNPYLKLFWLIFLLGFVDIFYNLPIFFQSIKQLLSIPITYFLHGFHLPSVENYTCKNRYILPFEGKWSVVNGGVYKAASHSWGMLPQRYAYDFLIIDETGKTHTGNGEAVEDYYCYGKNINAPADGKVIRVGNRCIDSKVYGNGSVDCSAKDIRGNYITIRHNHNEYSTIAHIMPNSILVTVGQEVRKGEVIAQCGNSGNSSEPHIHFQLQDGEGFFVSAGLPIRFCDVNITDNSGYSKYDKRPIPVCNMEISGKAEDEELIWIQRGQTAENRKRSTT